LSVGSRLDLDGGGVEADAGLLELAVEDVGVDLIEHRGDAGPIGGAQPDAGPGDVGRGRDVRGPPRT
jgi:hypothetical protein